MSDVGQRINVRGEEGLVEITSAYFKFAKDNTRTGHELRSLCIFLLAGIKTHKLETPVEILRGESPDFRFVVSGADVYLGLEHTRATVGKYKMDEKEFEEYPESSLMELPYYTLNGLLPNKSNIAMKMPGEELTSAGWGDYGMEKQWVEIIVHAIQKKTQVLNRTSFCRFAGDELIVEDDGPMSISYRFESAIDLLKKMPGELKLKDALTFDKIHIYSCDRLVYDVFGEGVVVDVPRMMR